MKIPTIDKLAQKDAERFAAAEMFYGEGAGTRRKLLDAELQSKHNMPGYYEAFIEAYADLDLNKFAKGAIKERQNIDRAAKASKNVRALKSGNVRGLSNGVFIVVGAAYLAHATGYDKKVEKEVRDFYTQVKARYKAKRASVTNIFDQPTAALQISSSEPIHSTRSTSNEFRNSISRRWVDQRCW